MKARKSFALFLTSILVMTMMLSACNSNNEAASGNGNTTPESTTNQPNQEEHVDPFGKYDPPIDVSAARFVTQDTIYPDGQSDKNNAWEDLYKEMGIHLTYDWVVKGTDAQYFQKLNVAIASGDIPDVLLVNPTQLKQLVEADMVADLSTVYEQYASPAVKQIFELDPNAINSAKYDGKLYGIPKTEPMIGAQTQLLWVRTDWLKKMNLNEPTSWEDVLNISKTFTTQDPDGNGKPDTFGIGLSKEIVNGYPSLNGFFNAYGAYPRIWKEDGTGKLVYGSIQPEMKAALAKASELYKSGEFDKEFGVKDGAKVAESVVDGRVGMLFGPSWASQWPIQDAKKKTPSSDWKPFAIPAVNGGDATVQMPFGANFYFVVSKEAKHPEIVVKMANLFIEKLYGETADYIKYGVDAKGVTTAKYSLIDLYMPDKDLNRAAAVAEALAAKDPAKLNPEEKSTYDKILAYENDGDLNFYGETLQSGPSGAMSILQKLVDDGEVLSEAYGGAPTNTMGEKRATLEKMENEIFTKIIYGSASIDQFDKFVKDWKALGGDKITEEVNAWNTQQ